MTKINKIGKSSFVIAILSFLLVGILAFGGTYAYFTAKTGTVTGSVTTGHLDLGTINATGGAITAESNTLAINNNIVVPNETLVNTIFSANVHSNIAFFSRVKFSVSIDVKADDVIAEGLENAGQPTDEAKAHQHSETDCRDKITNAIQALIIKLNSEAITAGSMTGTEATAFGSSNVEWKSVTPQGATGTEATAYFYNLKAHPATEIGTDTTLYFPAYIQLEDFLGSAIINDAQRCPYWMDATISISISFEVMQAEHVQGSAAVDGVFASETDAEDAWESALGVDNTLQNA